MKKLLLHSLLILLVLPYAAKATDYDRSKMDINPSIDPARKCADLIGKLNLPDFEAVGGGHPHTQRPHQPRLECRHLFGAGRETRLHSPRALLRAEKEMTHKN